MKNSPINDDELTMNDFMTIKDKLNREQGIVELTEYALAFYELGFLRGQARAEEDHRRQQLHTAKKPVNTANNAE